jgi:putative FmdB family regulatory protein
MPIYEYRCNDCRKRVSVYWRSFSEVETAQPRCPACGGEDLTRLISRVAVLRSEESRLEDLADPIPATWPAWTKTIPRAWPAG